MDRIGIGPYRGTFVQAIPIFAVGDPVGISSALDTWGRACRRRIEFPAGTWAVYVVHQGRMRRSVDSGLMDIGIRIEDNVYSYDQTGEGSTDFGTTIPVNAYRYMSHAVSGVVVQGGRTVDIEGVIIQRGTTGSVYIRQQSLSGMAIQVG